MSFTSLAYITLLAIVNKSKPLLVHDGPNRQRIDWAALLRFRRMSLLSFLLWLIVAATYYFMPMIHARTFVQDYKRTMFLSSDKQLIDRMERAHAALPSHLYAEYFRSLQNGERDTSDLRKKIESHPEPSLLLPGAITVLTFLWRGLIAILKRVNA